MISIRHALAGLVLLAGSPAFAGLPSACSAALLDAVRMEATAPPRAARAIAIAQVAVFDAVDTLVGLPYEPFLDLDAGPPGASPQAAAAQACFRALVTLFPAQSATFEALLASALGGIPDGPAKEAGVGHGDAVALALLAERADDGASATVGYETPLGAGWWARTPPAFAPPALPHWGNVRPFALAHGGEVRGPAPPSPRSAEYAEAFDEVLRFGAADSAERSAEQTEIALFWADGAGTETPPGHWLRIAGAVATSHLLPLVDEARWLALVGIGLADAGIAAWDGKYAYDHWRPYTALHAADIDGNPATAVAGSWSPLIATPPFPAFPSGHSTFSGAAARLLALLAGTEHHAFDTTSEGLPGVTRSFSSFTQAAAEAGQSRIYGGIHWQYDNTSGLEAGRALADLVWNRRLLPRAATETCAGDATTLCLNGGRFRARALWSQDGEDFLPAAAVQDGADSGRFWFLNEDNSELLLKVLDACVGFERYWVFVAGLTDFEVRIEIVDTATGATRRYSTDLGGAFQPVIDTGAFATCP